MTVRRSDVGRVGTRRRERGQEGRRRRRPRAQVSQPLGEFFYCVFWRENRQKVAIFRGNVWSGSLATASGRFYFVLRAVVEIERGASGRKG